ncbi:hypothetical protein BU16DRAFT_563304 [Lophium mytilinum]|uniref:beta-galactosidase n=1 Tax=Lophium mytilinum TaxID=390894 RepID=A0A6A6QQK0_9PEZI|nr:hypothetical protein BU16DRAFT_563304 [Lophium mytilinum]
MNLRLAASFLVTLWTLNLFRFVGFADASQRQTRGTDSLQNVDQYSMKINGERLMVYGGEFHPWRIPSPSLWLDILQKVKAMGLNTISIYINWSLIEAKKGDFRLDGVFSYHAFFHAASEVGLYVIVRPGPYINAELTGGGFPGWRFHAPEGVYWRVSNESFYSEIAPYVVVIGKLLAPHQITNNGTIILLQIENELSTPSVPGTEYPAYGDMDILASRFEKAGMVVPTIHNDVSHGGVFAGENVSQPEIYTYDYYPLSCGELPATMDQYDWTLYQQYSSYDPHLIGECGDGFYDQWGGIGYDNCPTQLDAGITRLFYKNRYSMFVTELSLYMIYGGTNWGHMSWQRVYTSCDFRAAISENRAISREKYGEIKLEAQFLKVAPAYRTSRLIHSASDAYSTSPNVFVSQTKDVLRGNTTFWTTRHADYRSTTNKTYLLKVPTTQGTLTIPQLGGSLTLAGYNSKIHVTDFAVRPYSILYSSAEIYTWLKLDFRYILVLYGASGETHETAIIASGSRQCHVNEGTINKCENHNGTYIINYVTVGQTAISIGSDILILILDRSTVYNWWVPELPTSKEIPTISNDTVLVGGPYLVHSATIQNSVISLTEDLNSTANLEVAGPKNVKAITWNGRHIPTSRTSYGTFKGHLEYDQPTVYLPSLEKLDWRSIDSLPEIQSAYDDSAWEVCDNNTTVNGARALSTPTNLYTGTYGYHVGNQLYRGHFIAAGNQTKLDLKISGGFTFRWSVWLNDTYLSAFTGQNTTQYTSKSFTLPQNITAGTPYVFTVLFEHMGNNENESGGITFLRGILNYTIDGKTPNITWKVTGNLGGEDYEDKVRGPLKKVASSQRDQVSLSPSPKHDLLVIVTSTRISLPTSSDTSVGSTFDLDLDASYDTPLSVNFEGTGSLRVNLFINGYKFGRYIANIGPQRSFPVPEGIINHQGENTIGLILWSLDAEGGKLTSLSLESTAAVQWAYGPVAKVEQPEYVLRPHAF